MRLARSIAVVSGASSGIGAATAEELARRGAASVALLARSQRRLAEVAARVERCGARAHVYSVDLSKLDEVEAVAEDVRREAGHPTLLVNNAGAGRWLFPEETPIDEAMRMMMVPYGAAFALTRHFLPKMLERREGHIVNVTSPAAFLAIPGATAYCAARWAMRGFDEALQADLHGTGVHTSLVAPGKVSTEYFANNPGSEQRIPRIVQLYPTLSAEAVARLIARAVERRQRVVVRPLTLALTVHWARFFPATIRRLLRATGARREGSG